MTVRPSGTVTFLFTDIEGSTRRGEADPDAMRVALTAHDDVLRRAVDGHGGWLFKHTGDGVCAAFGSPRAAIDAAVDAQRQLGLPVRMGIGTGEAELRGNDYFGSALNRAARVMTAGHGGQIVVAASTAALVDGVDLVDLGEHRLLDLSGAHRLFQLRAEGLRVEFAPLRTLDAVPGNLPLQVTSFIGRDVEVDELVAAVRTHRLVTLTGVGGVGKTRLAVQVAGEVVPEFPDGVWLVELAPVGDPGAVADAVAATLGITPRGGVSMVDCVAEGLAGRRVLVVLDNCEHVLDAAAELVDAMLARSGSVKVLATSREGMRVGAEHLWVVPSLAVREGVDSAAVALFVERARAVVTGFGLADNADAAAVAEICRRLDGIALGIELAAARMVSMSPADVRDRLGDRFRLLAGGRRGVERHQTLRHAVQWSFDLLDVDERNLLCACSVFAGGFDVAAAVQVCSDGADEYVVLDLLDSLVRKSLITADRSAGHSRYAMLETIRQYAEEQLAATGTVEQTRDRHARHFAAEADANFEKSVSPRQRDAHVWLDVELANLRAGFRWAADRSGLLDSAASIAANAAVMGAFLGINEPVGWAEALLDEAGADSLRRLRWVYTGAANCVFLGRADDAVGYGEAGLALSGDPRYDPVSHAMDYAILSYAHLAAGRPDKHLEVATAGIERSGDPTVLLRGAVVYALASTGRLDEAMAMAGDTVAAAEASGIPASIAYALNAYGKALADSDPARALVVTRRALTVAHDSNSPMIEALILGDLAGLEARHGEPRVALDSFDQALELYQQAGIITNLAVSFGDLSVFFDRVGRPAVAATLYGASTRDVAAATFVAELPKVADRLRGVLGAAVFDGLVGVGAAMDRGEAVRYAHAEIQRARDQLGVSS